MSDLENKENTEPSLNNIKINIDKLEGGGENSSNTYDKLSLDDLTEEPTLDKQPAEIEKLIEIKPKPKKVDRRKTTSRINIAKAREAKARKRAQQQERLKQLFGDSDSESGDTQTGSDTESEEDTYVNKYHRHKYKQLYSQTRKELDDMKSLLFKMAEKNKRHRRKQRRKKKKSDRTLTPDEEEKSPEERDPRRNVAQQPSIVNVYTTPTQETKQQGGNSLFTQMLRNRLKR